PGELAAVHRGRVGEVEVEVECRPRGMQRERGLRDTVGGGAVVQSQDDELPAGGLERAPPGQPDLPVHAVVVRLRMRDLELRAVPHDHPDVREPPVATVQPGEEGAPEAVTAAQDDVAGLGLRGARRRRRDARRQDADGDHGDERGKHGPAGTGRPSTPRYFLTPTFYCPSILRRSRVDSPSCAATKTSARVSVILFTFTIR